MIAPTAPDEYWSDGFGQTLNWRGRSLSYRIKGDRMTGDYRGDGSQRLEVRLLRPLKNATATLTVNGQSVDAAGEGERVVVPLPAATDPPCHFEVHLVPATP